MSKPKPCPNAKKASGKYRFVGEREYKCKCGAACSLCHGYGMTIECDGCQGCGLVLGSRCGKCNGSGRCPATAQEKLNG